MVKASDKKEIATSDVSSYPELLFNSDAMTITFLNAMMVSNPAFAIDSEEKQFIRLTTDGRPIYPAVSSGSFNAVASFETERLKFEAESLAIENKGLKFKTELALIDAQVLKGENDNLKAVIADLKVQQREMQHRLDTLASEAEELKARYNSYQNQLNISASNENSPLLNSIPVSGLEVDQSVDNGKETEQAISNVINDNETVSVPAKQQEIPANTISEVPPAIGGNLDRIVISQCTVEINHGTNQEVNRAVIFSQNKIEGSTMVRSVTPASTVIKRTVLGNQLQPTRDKASKLTPKTTSSMEEADTYAEWKPIGVLQQHESVLEFRQEENVSENTIRYPEDNTDEIDIEPAAVPKVVVRRNVKSYKDLQKESELNNEAKGHNLVL